MFFFLFVMKKDLQLLWKCHSRHTACVHASCHYFHNAMSPAAKINIRLVGKHVEPCLLRPVRADRSEQTTLSWKRGLKVRRTKMGCSDRGQIEVLPW